MWRIFRRKPRLPAERRPALDRDERVVAWAAVDRGDVVVATDRGLFLPGRSRLGWHEIHKATWSGRALSVLPAEVVAEEPGYAVVEDLPAVTYTLLEPGDVPHQVRARVTKSVAYTSHHPVPGGGLRVVARRVSGVDGLWWTVRFDPGTDRDRPETSALVAAARLDVGPKP
ncbi:MAG TPA: hypothetical protein VFC00_39980 [Micromonosporaceae bacterium]|nr:hypothetical protein [Micromonosporaceae bacterium]